MKTRSAYARRGSQVATAAALSALILAQSSPVLSVSYYLVTDVPTTLGGTAYTPNQVVRSDSGAYALEAALPVGTEFGAVDRSPDGVWLFAPAHPVTLNPTTFEPRDLISFDGLSFALALDCVFR